MTDVGVINSVANAYAPLIKYADAWNQKPFSDFSATKFFNVAPMPQGVDREEFLIKTSGIASAGYVAPGVAPPRVKSEGTSKYITLRDKIALAAEATDEKVRAGRFNILQEAQEMAIDGVMEKTNYELLDLITSGAMASPYTPVDGTADELVVANSNDTIAPPPYNGQTFSAGHDHVESSTAATLGADLPAFITRVTNIRAHLTEHGYALNGMVAYANPAQLATVLSYAGTNAVPDSIRQEWLKMGEVASVFLGVTWISESRIPAGVVVFADPSFRGEMRTGLETGAKTIRDDDKGVTVNRYQTQFGIGIAQKYAIYVAHVA